MFLSHFAPVLSRQLRKSFSVPSAKEGLTAGFGMTKYLGEVRLKASRGKQLGSGREAIVKTKTYGSRLEGIPVRRCGVLLLSLLPFDYCLTIV